MDLKKVIDTSRSLAQRFVAKGHETVRLPVFTFDDWRAVYDRPGDGASLADYQRQVKQNWYLMHFLRAMEVEVLPVPVAAGPFAAWAQETDHKLSDGHELAHAVGEYVNDPETPVSSCRHGSLNPDFDGLGGMATITVLGEEEDAPEVMTVVQHTSDGQVLQSLQMAAVDFSPQAAWEEAQRFLGRVRPDKVFHDEKVRKPEYCTDCNGLLVSVASPEDVAASN
ncbi:MAG: hypothetical protein K9K66_13190 [Desulfarculaceae bacterium]|nr:hypothetical protein [Desulfarculaceae bacterium]MCF8072727.1 hypothetical protein [Desulfarculaceae bacterium]MCF8102606.1 hypothetical protein [Desulfarculaceae bacterium]MCF8116515.1 hypothetical protein [Desulfarculaceae bacterium]